MKAFATTILLVLMGPALTGLAQAQPGDPRLGEWREDHYAGAVGLYLVYEDLGNGITRTHNGENLAPQNRLHEDTRCDGKDYPRLNSAGQPSGVTVSCEIVNASTVKFSQKNSAGDGWVSGEGKWILSDDKQHSTGTFVRKDANGKVVAWVSRLFTRNAENCLNHEEEAKFRECVTRTRPPRRQ